MGNIVYSTIAQDGQRILRWRGFLEPLVSSFPSVSASCHSFFIGTLGAASIH